MKVIEGSADRRTSAHPSTGRKLLCAGVIRRAGDSRPTLRLAARVDDAALRISHTPDWKPAA